MRKEKKLKVIHVNSHRKIVIALWVVLIISFIFAVYKNFTAVDKHTVHEKEVIEEKMLDTNAIENFVMKFVKVYYSWENNTVSLNNRTSALGAYMTEELQNLNYDSVRQDVPTCSAVTSASIWNIEALSENEYKVTYSVLQNITEGENVTQAESYYDIVVYVDESENMVIIKNPTLANISSKSSYAPEKIESDNSVDAEIANSATEFLQTFFRMYPGSSKEELVYYVKDGVLGSVAGDYVFSELVNPVYIKDEEDIICHVAVKYLDNRTKSTQISQYILRLHKEDNWMITGME